LRVCWCELRWRSTGGKSVSRSNTDTGCLPRQAPDPLRAVDLFRVGLCRPGQARILPAILQTHTFLRAFFQGITLEAVVHILYVAEAALQQVIRTGLATGRS